MALLYFVFMAVLFGFFSSGETVKGSLKSRCTQLQVPEIPGAKVLSISGVIKQNYSIPASVFLATPITGLDFCEVGVVLTHPNAGDHVAIQVWLPLEDWNGRFQATGGSGYAAGNFDPSLGPAIQLGYSAAATDSGVTLNPASPAAWALRKDGTVNWVALTNFAHRSVHDLGIVGQDVTRQFYGKKPNYSYWNGCSTGGRQGMAAAQRYPQIFNGILAGAPAINWAEYVLAEQWPQVVMKEEGEFPSQCELEYFTACAIEQCDELDGIKDGIITEPDLCQFDPYRIVGDMVQCGGETLTIREATARIVEKTLGGPFSSNGDPLWYGPSVGAPLDSLANTTVINGKRIGFPFFVNDAWIKYWLAQNPSYDTSNIDYQTFREFFAQSKAEYDGIIGTDDPDLSGFRNAGGKLIIWQGLSDQLIFPKGTVQYRRRVERLMGGPSPVNEFFRLFFAPGVDHCAGGTTIGAVPTDPLGSLVAWVEDKKIPETLAAEVSGTEIERILCPYPQVARYFGGDKSSAKSFQCVSYGL